ncbi:MAG: Fic family protein [Myxococcales bacterium]|nr:Fic family protein [Myxococcales bacterium]
MGSSIDLETPDTVRTYTEEHLEQLTRNLHTIEVALRSGAFRQCVIDLDLLCDLHRRLFRDVRSHAGRIRDTRWGSESLVFGPNRSADRRSVPELLRNVLRRAQVDRRDLLDIDDASRSMMDCFELAVRAHADVIKIHPFEDGNGRTSRLLMSVILESFDIEPTLAEFPKHEYNECLNVYHKHGDLGPISDLLLNAHPLLTTDR